MASRDEVMVVGAGPTGLHLAGELARRGVRVRVVDRRTAATTESRALALHARTLELLDTSGLAGALTAAGRRVDGFSLWDGTRRLARVDFRTLDSPFPFLLDLPQHDTERILRRHLEVHGVHVEQSTELTGLVPHPRDVELVLRRPDGTTQRARADYVVGCDGAHSTVRGQMGLPFTGHGYPQDWLLADVTLRWNRPREDVHVVFNPTGRAVVFMPLPEGRWRVVLYFAGDRPAPGGAPGLEEIQGLLTQRVPAVSVSDLRWSARFRTHRRSAPDHRRGRVFLAGDAVHIHSPAGGQGLNIGLQDAHDLAWKLAAVILDGASEELLDSYQAERAPVARQVLRMSHGLVRLSSLTGRGARAARGVVVPLAARSAAVRHRAARRISGLDVAHRDSPLHRPTSPPLARGTARAGDRAPAALHPVLRSPHHAAVVVGTSDGGLDPVGVVRRLRPWDRLLRLVVVVPPGGAPPAAEVATVADTDGSLHRTLGSGVHLIRPDTYLAASGLVAVEGYLRKLYGHLGSTTGAGASPAVMGMHIENDGVLSETPARADRHPAQADPARSSSHQARTRRAR